MPGDSLASRDKKNNQDHFDAIVVGSGISGGWAAKELCEKGLRVLILERGRDIVHPHYPDATKNIWEFPHRGSLTLADKERCFIQSRHYSYREDNKEYYIDDRQNPYEEINRFDWIRGDILGGRSLLWARQCYRLSDLDFGANAREGVGVDWPIRYRDIAPWYDYVESYIGVSGRKEDLPQLPDGRFQPAMEMNCVEKDFKARLEKKYPDRRVTIGRTANLTEPVNGRNSCQYRNLCHRGCPFGAYFSSNSATLPAAMATGRLTIKTGYLVNRVTVDERSAKATGVEAIEMQTGRVTEFHSRILFLNAAPLATAFILLNSTSSRFPNGLGNGSDQVGRNLMDHHKTLGISASVEGFEDSYYYGRRPNGIYLPRFKNIHEKQKDYLRGFGFQGGAYRQRGASPGEGLQIGSAYKEKMEEAGPWSIGFTGFGECLPYADNRVTLNTARKDHWGRNTLSVNAVFRDNEKAMNRDILATAQEFLEETGYSHIHIVQGMSFPGNSNHEMGTARMGKDPRTSVLNAYNQMHEVKNVFITDGSFMVSSSCVNPSLTYMAITARAADYACREMSKQNI